MKSIYLFCTNLWCYIIELPIVLLFIITASYNEHSAELTKLYPLLVLLVLAALFILVYFFRLVRINFGEARCIGPFSSRDSSVIKRDRTLMISILSGRRLKLEIFGKNEAPTLDWINPEDYKDKDVNLFRAKAVGKYGAVKKILRYFDVNSADFEKIFGKEDFHTEYKDINLTSGMNGDIKQIKLYFKETL